MHTWSGPSQLGVAAALHVPAQAERYCHRNGTHIRAAMDKLQARFELAS